MGALRAFLAVATVTVALAWAHRASADCNALAAIAVLVAGGTGAGSSLVVGLTVPAVVAAANQTKRYDYGAAFGMSAGLGIGVSGAYMLVDFASGCSIAGEIPLRSVVIAVSAGAALVSATTAVVLWFVAGDQPIAIVPVAPLGDGVGTKAVLRF